MWIVFPIVGIAISIHVPREGNDKRPLRFSSRAALFLSTFPARGTTQPAQLGIEIKDISIHVPREGNDAPGRISMGSSE